MVVGRCNSFVDGSLMDLTLSIILLLLFGAFLVAYSMGKNSASVKKAQINSERNAKQSQDRRWYAVVVEPGPRACAAVNRLGDKPFLMAEAPSLPLAQCKVNCHCKFRHMADRRQESRRVPFSENSAFANAAGFNRRQGSGRRRSDRQSRVAHI